MQFGKAAFSPARNLAPTVPPSRRIECWTLKSMGRFRTPGSVLPLSRWVVGCLRNRESVQMRQLFISTSFSLLLILHP